MIQLGYYPSTQPTAPQDESIDFDPNYDPSDFLIKKDSSAAQLEQIQPQQQYQDAYDYAANMQEAVGGDEMQQQPNYYGSFAQQSFNDNDFGFQQPQQMSQEDYSQPQQPQAQLMIPSDGGGLADLDISDSDDEDDQMEQVEDVNTSTQNPADTSKDDDDGLWF